MRGQTPCDTVQGTQHKVNSYKDAPSGMPLLNALLSAAKDHFDETLGWRNTSCSYQKAAPVSTPPFQSAGLAGLRRTQESPHLRTEASLVDFMPTENSEQ